MCMTDYDESWVSFNPTWRMARRAHKCDECGRTIEPGERYRRCGGTTERRVYISPKCEQCAAASQWLLQVCRGYLHGGVEEDLGSHWSVPDYRCVGLGRLIVGMGNDWRRRDGALFRPADVERWTADAIAHAKTVEAQADAV